MKPDSTVFRAVDGGWWPHDTDPGEEFSDLIEAVTPTVGAVSRVAYHLDAWSAVPRKVTVQARQVRLEGFRTMRPHTVTVIGRDRRRTTLLVVPPDTPGGAARAILRTASDQDSTGGTEDILASNGVGEAATAHGSPPAQTVHTG